MTPKLKLPRRVRHNTWVPKVDLPAAEKPQFAADPEQEVLSGVVQGKKASAYEERAVRAFSKKQSVNDIYFRVAVGADRNLPGWKELDILVASKGMYKAFEVDSEFTHNTKQNADVLHDAIILNALQADGLQVYPKVFHLSGERELSTQEDADRMASQFYAN